MAKANGKGKRQRQRQTAKAALDKKISLHPAVGVVNLLLGPVLSNKGRYLQQKGRYLQAPRGSRREMANTVHNTWAKANAKAN